MATDEHKRMTEWVLAQAAQINPYARSQANLKSEYYIHQMGFLASYLASLMEEDPYIARRYQKHIKDVYDSKRAKARLNSSNEQEVKRNNV